jgi:hypothetical protein
MLLRTRTCTLHFFSIERFDLTDKLLGSTPSTKNGRFGIDVRHEPTPILTPPERDLLPSKETAASFFVAVMGQVSERIP